MKKTLVLGASTNPDRYSNRATRMLAQHGHEVIPVGIKAGHIDDIEIITKPADWKDIDTVTLYLRPALQASYYDYIIGLRPNRIIFNPGTENPVLSQRARDAGIATEAACTLVLLSTGQY
ncbi:MAG: CoA-binding protein [Bacteroidota bacterium]